MRFTIDEIEDLKIAVDELSAYLTGAQGRDGNLEISFMVHDNKLEIAGAGRFAPGQKVRTDLTELSRMILHTVVDSASLATGRRDAGVRTREKQGVMNDRTMLDKDQVRELFVAYQSAADEETKLEYRERLVEQFIGLVEFLARRFRNRGEPIEDLVQVGTIGLLKAIDRFDLEREVEFSTYATPTIVGELKRHFRDKGWAVRVPRRLQELHLELTKFVSHLGQELGRSPTVPEIAEAANLTEEQVLEGLEIAQAYNFASLDAPITSDDGGHDLLRRPAGRARTSNSRTSNTGRRWRPRWRSSPSVSGGSSTSGSSRG